MTLADVTLADVLAYLFLWIAGSILLFAGLGAIVAGLRRRGRRP